MQQEFDECDQPTHHFYSITFVRCSPAPSTLVRRRHPPITWLDARSLDAFRCTTYCVHTASTPPEQLHFLTRPQQPADAAYFFTFYLTGNDFMAYMALLALMALHEQRIRVRYLMIMHEYFLHTVYE